LAPDACLALGLDVGGRFTRVIVLDTVGQTLFAQAVPTPVASSGTALLAELDMLARHALDSLGARRSSVCGLGVAFSGFIDNRSGTSINAPNIAGARDLPLQAALQAAFNLPVMVDDSSRAMTLAEMRYGAGQGIENFLCVNIGAGIGMGIVVDGQLYRGGLGFAGEIGHIPVQPGGARCHCGNQGCLETLSSGWGIAARACDLLKQGAPSLLHDLTAGAPENVTAELVTQAAQAGDQLALDLLDSAGMWLGTALAAAVNLFSPQKVILTGGGIRSNETLLEAVRATAERYVLPHTPRPLAFVVTQLDQQAGALGAATLILDVAFDTGFAQQLAQARA
jgi:glucokinase